mgnify:CR=1 FL=1|tara:strand:+ start:958 stop:1275 length:318 start_codon:yes stop_codon:yes gene_type:complete
MPYPMKKKEKQMGNITETDYFEKLAEEQERKSIEEWKENHKATKKVKRYIYEVKKWLIYEVDAKNEESALKKLCDDFDLAPTDEGFEADAFLNADLLEVVNIREG